MFNVGQFKRESELDTESKRKKRKTSLASASTFQFFDRSVAHDFLVKYQNHLPSGNSTELSTCIEQSEKS